MILAAKRRCAVEQGAAHQIALGTITAADFGKYSLPEQSQLSNGYWSVFASDVSSQTGAALSVASNLAWNSLLQYDQSQHIVLCSRKMLIAVFTEKATTGEMSLPKDLAEELDKAEKVYCTYRQDRAAQQLQHIRDWFWLATACTFRDESRLANVKNRSMAASVKSELLLTRSLGLSLASNVEAERGYLYQAAILHLGASMQTDTQGEMRENGSLFLAYQLLRQWLLLTHDSLLDGKTCQALATKLTCAGHGHLLARIGHVEWLVDQAVLFADESSYLEGLHILDSLSEADFSRCDLPSKKVYETVFAFRYFRALGNRFDHLCDFDNWVTKCGKSFPMRQCLGAQPYVSLRFGLAFHLRMLGDDLDSLLCASSFSQEDVPELDAFIDWLSSHTDVCTIVGPNHVVPILITKRCRLWVCL